MYTCIYIPSYTPIFVRKYITIYTLKTYVVVARTNIDPAILLLLGADHQIK